MLTFADEQNNEFMAQATITKTDGVNGEKSLTGIIYFGQEVKDNLAKGWTLYFKDEVYMIITYNKNDQDNTVNFTAVHDFFFRFNRYGFEEKWNGSHPISNYLNALFDSSGYTVEYTGSAPAREEENWGMKDRLTLLNDVVNDAGLEYYVQGQVVHVKDRIGSDLSTIVRKKFNLNTAEIQTDNTSFATHGVGFGAYSIENDESSPRLRVEYKSPLYDYYAPKFGQIDAPIIDDQRYTDENSLREAIVKVVDNSWSISITMTLVDLQKAGYDYAMATPGDSIYVIDENVNFEAQVRIVKVETDYDINGDVTETKVTCGSLSLSDQQKASSSTMTNVANGVKAIPNEWLTTQVQTATNDLLNARTQLSFTDQGIIAIDKSNSNKLVILNSAGIGVSTDGGKNFKTAVTADGVVADRLYGNLIQGVNFKTTSTTGFSLELQNGHIDFLKENGQLGGLASTTDSATGSPNGVALINRRGYNLSLNQANDEGTLSKPIFQVPNNSTYDDLKYNIFGTCQSDLNLASNIRFKKSNGAWVINDGNLEFSANDGGGNQFEVNGNGAAVLGDFTVYNGTKNAAQITRDGIRATPAYETAENYVGDIGESKTGQDNTVEIEIDPLVYDMVNTEMGYQVFVTPYSAARVWVSQRDDMSFVIESDTPNAPFGWELKAHRRGYENQRLVDTGKTYNDLKKMEGMTLNGNQNVQSNS